MSSTSSVTIGLITTLITLLVAAYFYIKHKYQYWKRLGIIQLSPTFPLGNFGHILPSRVIPWNIQYKIFDAFKKSANKIGGVYLGLDPYLVVVDPGYAKDMLTKDFQYFVDRGVYSNKKYPITVTIFTQRGEEWRNSRTKTTSIFTSAKMRFFFNTIKECSDELKANLETLEKDETDIDIYEIMGCYFTDIIGSLTFGIKANSFKDPNAIFRKLGRDLFGSFTKLFQIKLFLTICYPKLAKAFGVINIQPQIDKFFYHFVPEALENRIKNDIYRADFLQLLIELKNSGVDLTLEEMVAQSFNFYAAGFETSSSTAMFLLYELGLHKNIQEKARVEILNVLKKHDGDLTYESLQEMTYLSQIISETIRKYPLVPTFIRMCVKDYTFPNGDLVIKKGTGIIIPVLSYHREPSTFPEPMKFDPDRFEDKNIKYAGYLPFGDGPRNCIGERLGLMQVKLGVVEVIRNYEIAVSPKTTDPIEFDDSTMLTKPSKTIFLKLKKI
ncbi:unnamed protein product [Psylliodes chrysocephalus]|uniref:Cytochrome P450 n=1 Tax=Psylliodes chrysocephalus TaxID=3402493 RepID=A0A9P0GDA7_9CUCU|nr:unnamed protein product [Psylliodes chrysocephala]